jgi:hypothetical protein
LSKSILSIFLVLAVITYSQSAAAYLDPGTGSFMLQMLIAGIMGALFTIKLYWYRLKAFLTQLFGRDTGVSTEVANDKQPESDDNK